jgi:hypothetical protein
VCRNVDGGVQEVVSAERLVILVDQAGGCVATPLIVDEVGYIPFEQHAANLFFQLVSSRYEHASLILTSNLPFSRWGDVFSDHAAAAAMIDRIVHHADVLTLKGKQLPTPQHRNQHTPVPADGQHGWRDGAAAIAMLTFAVDAETPVLAAGRHANNTMAMTHQAFDARRGLPRLLGILDESDIKATS